MTTLFDKCFDFLCELEGFSSNVEGDPGGRTIWGIAERYFPQEVAAMLKMSPDESKQYAKQFYLTRFWTNHPDPHISATAFLMGVNAPAPAKRAISEGRSWEGILIAYVEYYANTVGKHPNLLKFLRGWCNRITRVWRFVSCL